MSTVKTIKPDMAETFQTVGCLKLVNGLFSSSGVDVVVEREISVYLNGCHLATASINPGMEREFAMGYLFTQGFIDSPGELESLEIRENAARAILKDRGRLPDITESGHYVVSGGGKAARAGNTSYPVVRTDLKISKTAVFTAMNRLFQAAELYQATEGVHGAGLFSVEASPVCTVEDIGRHNCLDKLTGYALMQGIDCSRTFLVTTGRITSEMVAKICRAGIPVAATKTAVTDKGLETARRYGVTVIGFVRDAGSRINTNMETRTITKAGMKIYTNARRIENR